MYGLVRDLGIVCDILEVIVMRRNRMSKRKSRRSFSKGASRTHRKNLSPAPMRGGIRL